MGEMTGTSCKEKIPCNSRDYYMSVSLVSLHIEKRPVEERVPKRLVFPGYKQKPNQSERTALANRPPRRRTALRNAALPAPLKLGS